MKNKTEAVLKIIQEHGHLTLAATIIANHKVASGVTVDFYCDTLDRIFQFKRDDNTIIEELLSDNNVTWLNGDDSAIRIFAQIETTIAIILYAYSEQNQTAN